MSAVHVTYTVIRETILRSLISQGVGAWEPDNRGTRSVKDRRQQGPAVFTDR